MPYVTKNPLGKTEPFITRLTFEKNPICELATDKLMDEAIIKHGIERNKLMPKLAKDIKIPRVPKILIIEPIEKLTEKPRTKIVTGMIATPKTLKDKRKINIGYLKTDQSEIKKFCLLFRAAYT